MRTADASPTLARVLKGELCSGCGLCAGVAGDAVALTTVAPGYRRPEVIAPLSPVAERTVALACPGSRVAPWQKEAGAHHHPYWGPYRAVATGYATDPEVRHRSSSGGALSALLIHALETGQVDRVLHVSADPALPTRNRLTVSRTRAEVLDGAGSRYAASSPLESIDAMLGEGGRMAFVGKPCDIAALRQLGRVDERVAAVVPLMLSFFCGGLPSHAGADRIVRAMGFDPAEVSSFRYRGNGWPGLTRAETQDGRVGEMRYEDSWGRHLSSEIQYRCKICPDAVGGVADVAAADAWYGGERGYPEFEEQDGRSLVVTRTAAGAALVEAAAAAGGIALEPLPVGEIDKMQPFHARRKRLLASRLAAAAATLQPRPDMRGLAVGEAARHAGVGESARNFLGSVRRIVQGRR